MGSSVSKIFSESLVLSQISQSAFVAKGIVHVNGSGWELDMWLRWYQGAPAVCAEAESGGG